MLSPFQFTQVIFVGHDFGGVCISYAMKLFPSKIAKAVFIAASMLKSGQSTLDMFSQKVWPLIHKYFTLLSYKELCETWLIFKCQLNPDLFYNLKMRKH